MVSHDDLSSFDTSGITIIKPNSDAEIAAAYRKSDIFISTSWHEGFGLPPLEAMACGCACILSESGGIDEYARPEENCLTFPPKNEQLLREKLLRLLCDASLRERLAQNGQHTASRFSWEKSTQQLTDIIME